MGTNLWRNGLITGDHAACAETNKGLHGIGTYGGTMRVSHTRVEWCGQSAAEPPLGTGVKGRYCLHMHHMSHCPECVVEGNAIEHGIEKGVTVHDTHDMLVHRNVVWDLRGAPPRTADEWRREAAGWPLGAAAAASAAARRRIAAQ